jgi:hypothetical protein
VSASRPLQHSADLDGIGLAVGKSRFGGLQDADVGEENVRLREKTQTQT